MHPNAMSVSKGARESRGGTSACELRQQVQNACDHAHAMVRSVTLPEYCDHLVHRACFTLARRMLASQCVHLRDHDVHKCDTAVAVTACARRSYVIPLVFVRLPCLTPDGATPVACSMRSKLSQGRHVSSAAALKASKGTFSCTAVHRWWHAQIKALTTGPRMR